MIIPIESLSAEALQGILEEFITREGTDYGSTELTLDDKVARLKPQLESGDIVLVYDESLGAVNLVNRRQLVG